MKANRQKANDVRVKVDWQYTQEVSPAFKRLMMILLQERVENGEKANKREPGPDC